MLNKDIFSNKSASIAVVGLGYVGLPLLLRIVKQGFRGIGFDINSGHIAEIQSGKSPFVNIESQDIVDSLKKNMSLIDDYEGLREADAIILCLPTPLNKNREPDLSCIVSALNLIKNHIKHGCLVSLESTTWPGTTKEIILPILETAGLQAGEDIAVVYSPEREDPGNVLKVHDIPKVIGGITPKCLEIGSAFYQEIVEQVVPVSSTEAAELTKLLENIQRMVNIGLMNEMKVVSKKMGIDIFEVIDAASTKP